MTHDIQRVDAVLTRFAELHPKLIDLTLERGLGLLDKLGNPHLELPPVLHLAGTNGKGSTLAFLRSMCEAAGMVTHAYVSPHLVRFHERIRIAGQLLDDAALADLLEEVERINDGAPITFFEITTAAAFYAFTQKKADVTLLETGLGGRGDSTNVVPKPLATVITPIAQDHEHFLGDNLAAIAQEKAGIMRADVPCFSAAQKPEVEKVLQNYADRIGTPLYLAGRDFTISHSEAGVVTTLGARRLTLSELGLKGGHQRDNAGLAGVVMMHAFPEIDDAALSNGARRAIWPGRVQNLTHGALMTQCGEIPLWLDGAHNAHGGEALVACLGEILAAQKWVLIWGGLNTREPKDFFSTIMGVVAETFTVTIPDQDSALNAARLAEVARSTGGIATPTDSVDEALRLAVEAARNIDGAIIIAGSLYLAGHVLALNDTLPD